MKRKLNIFEIRLPLDVYGCTKETIDAERLITSAGEPASAQLILNPKTDTASVIFKAGIDSETLTVPLKDAFGRFSCQFPDNNCVYSLFVTPIDDEYDPASYISETEITHPEYLRYSDWQRLTGELRKLGYDIYDGDDLAGMYHARRSLRPDQLETAKWVLGKTPLPPKFVPDYELEIRAVAHFGITPYFDLVGYITPSGDKLNFSRERIQRDIDHREVQDLFDNLTGTDAMIEFMRRGNIRVNTAGISMIHPPAEQQWRGIVSFMHQNKQTNARSFCVDLLSPSGTTLVASKEYSAFTPFSTVRDEIEHFFETGCMPE